MGTTLQQRLKGLGIESLIPLAPGGNFVAVRRTGNLLFFSGQVQGSGGVGHFVRKVGNELTPKQGQAATRLCAINTLFPVMWQC